MKHSYLSVSQKLLHSHSVMCWFIVMHKEPNVWCVQGISDYTHSFWGPGVAQWLRHCATSRTVLGSNLGGVDCWDFSQGYRQNHVPWGQLTLQKWVPGISPGVKAAGAWGWWPTTLVVPNVKYFGALTYPDPLGHLDSLLWVTFTFYSFLLRVIP